eukprot:TRINITY_DN67594_c0_g1_i1.p1 TRINITY_DN67594_c0_g1~~TRINITY_DN67594_c0_g1_i1.p1  ORF type:complete len:416 (-),score=66.57 TRINITY_DN67594_c0_g1_i1:57-1304(-)
MGDVGTASDFPQEVCRRYTILSADCSSSSPQHPRCLGSGAYGEVFLARPRWELRQQRRSLRKCKRIALKRCYGAADISDVITLQRTFRELSVLRQLRHENIVVLRDVILPTSGIDFFLAFDLADQDLNAAIRSNALSSVAQLQITCDLLRALKHLHGALLLHRDLKPSNVLLDSSFRARLCDFGFVRLVGMYKRDLTEYVGMRWYRAPEILLGSRSYDSSVDIWSLGCVVGEMALGRPLTAGVSAEEQLGLILGLTVGHRPDKADMSLPGVPESGRSLLLNTRPIGKRLATKLEGSAEANMLNFLDGCLQLEPEDRQQARKLLQHSLFDDFRRERDELLEMPPMALALQDGQVHSPQAYLNELQNEADLFFRQEEEDLTEHEDSSDSSDTSDVSSSPSPSNNADQVAETVGSFPV